MTWSEQLNARIVRCRLCPRLTAYLERVGGEKKREFRDWEYWAKPVPSFGVPNARLLVIGLAPAAHGGNRTGRVFTGDSSGRWLFRALHKAGFANQPTWQRRDDGMRLLDCYITAVIHCAPPDNKPLPEEIGRCSRYFDEELQRLKRVRVVIALGKIAFDNYLKGLRRLGVELPKPLPRFGHNTVHELDLCSRSVSCGGTEASPRFTGSTSATRTVALIASYHPSRQNTNTGKLTEPMFDAVFARAKKLLVDLV
jgi:uracil-DNA glycosylase family 4